MKGVPRLNRLLTLEAPERQDDGAGGFSETWSTRGRHWAEVRARPGREVRLGAANVSRATHEIVVRASGYDAPSRPKPTDRFREGPRSFRVLSIADADQNGRYLVCIAVEEVAA